MKDFLHAHKKKLLFSALASVLLFGLGALFWPNKEVRETTMVSYQDIQKTVSVSGTIESENRVDLRFGTSGTVENIYAKSGAFYKKGDLLFALDTRKADADLARAQANVASAKAEYDLMMAGPSNEEIKISELQIQEANARYQAAQTELENTQMNNAEEARRSRLDIQKASLDLKKAEEDLRLQGLQDNNTLTQDQLNLEESLDSSKADTQAILYDIRDSLILIDGILGRDKEPFNELFPDLISQAPGLTEQDLLLGYLEAKQGRQQLELAYGGLLSDWRLTEVLAWMFEAQNLAEKSFYLIDLALVAIDAIEVPAESSLDQEIASLRADLLAQRANLQLNYQILLGTIEELQGFQLGNVSLELESSLLVAQTNYDKMSLAYEKALSEAESIRVQSVIKETQAQSELEVYASLLAQAEARHADLIAPPRPVELASYRARVREAEASLARSAGDKRDALIYAPSDGILGRIEVNVGDQVNNTMMIAPFVSENYRIKANISESDIAWLALAQKAQVSLDALSSDEIFNAEIVAIDPVETNIQGVIYYETILFFDQEDTRFKPGMTVNVDILVGEAKEVLAIDPASFFEKDSENYVILWDGSKETQRKIQLGLEGDLAVEVREGLLEGDVLILYPEE